METKQPNHARQLFLDVLNWLRQTYASHHFFLQRDVAWTSQKHLLARTCSWIPPDQVIHNHKVPGDARRQFDLALVERDGTVDLALKFRFEPAQVLAPGKRPVVVWADVEEDIRRVQSLVTGRKARNACSLFIDESGLFRKRPAPRGSRWEDWDIGAGTRIAVLISEA